MKHHAETKENYNLYYLVALVAGLFAGFVVDIGIVCTITCGVVGLLFAALFVNVLVKGRADV